LNIELAKPMSLLKSIKLDDFVVLDLETTGLDPTSDRIIEIGALRYRDGKEVEKYESFVNPEMPIPDFITKLTGISDTDVQDAPVIEKIFAELIEFIADSPLVGHQINFDCSFLEYQYRIRNNDFKKWEIESQRFVYLRSRRMDTLFIARIFLPFLQRFRLASVAAHFKIDLENAHRAIDDARATGRIFLELIDRTLACNTQILRQIIRLLYKNSARVKYFFKPILDYKIENNIDVTNAGITEDVAYVQNYYNIIGEADYKRETIDAEIPIEFIDEDMISHAISGEGRLKNALNNFEDRPQQEKMARLIARAFNKREFLIVEAGTGTGKSMAYLFPAVEWAVKNRENNERVLISTNTKNLQEQLFFQDIPTAHATSSKKFKAVLLKGKSNYLCLDRWKATLVDMDQRLSTQERVRILPLILWAEQTQTGDIAENTGFQLNQNWGLWGKLIAENNYCPGRTCKFYQECFLMRARNNARKADIVVVNHSLLFSDLVTDNSILGTYNNLILDEAHNLEKTAGDYLGVRFNWWTFRNIYHKLYEEEPKKTGSIVQLEYRLNLARLPASLLDRMTRQINRVKTESIGFKRNSEQFFSSLNQSLREKSQKQNQNGSEETKIRYHRKFRHFTELFEIIDDLKRNISTLKKSVSNLLDIFADIRSDSFQFQDQIHRELISFETDLETLAHSLEFCINADEDNYVYWLELPFRKGSNDVSFNAVPLNIAELLKKTLYAQLGSAVFTSATLAVNGSFSYYKNRVGLNLVQHADIKSAVLGSPFDYENQLSLFILDFLDDPRNERFAEQLSGLIKETHRNHPTGMLVLFTNYSVLNKLYSEMKIHFEMEKILLLAQGKSGSRTNIINQFREYKNSILFGTDSFWEGVDVPGDALELLLITKLPFDVPTEPLIAAKLEMIKRSGGNPFLDFSVPEAIIKFRQGFGRLIRHKNDIGAVLICDNRLSRMQYGHQFLNSLPVNGKIIKDSQTLFTELADWFDKKSMTAGKIYEG